MSWARVQIRGRMFPTDLLQPMAALITEKLHLLLSDATYLIRLHHNRTATQRVWLNTTKDCKGPQRTTNGMTKYRKGCKKTTNDCKGTLWARLQEIDTNWNQWCLIIFQCAPKFFKTRSFTSVFILCLLGTHYWLICIVKIFDLRNKNNCYVISIIVTTT